MQALQRNPKFQGRKGPVVLAIMDGVGIGKYKEGDAVLDSPTPFLHKLMATMPYTQLKAHGTAVGLPSDADMGNSEDAIALIDRRNAVALSSGTPK